jgi:hypothetical protein
VASTLRISLAVSHDQFAAQSLRGCSQAFRQNRSWRLIESRRKPGEGLEKLAKFCRIQLVSPHVFLFGHNRRCSFAFLQECDFTADVIGTKGCEDRPRAAPRQFYSSFALPNDEPVVASISFGDDGMMGSPRL